MTLTVTEGRLTFEFPEDVVASKYDQWGFYRNQINNCFGGTKAVDILCLDTEDLWLIEVKDYRANARTKVINLGEEVALKVRDTLWGLVAAQVNANDAEEKKWARKAVSSKRIHVVLHLEQPQKHSRAFPRVVEPANLKLKLKQLLKPVDLHPKVVSQGNLASNMRWTVRG